MPLNHQLSPTKDVTDLGDAREPGIKIKHHSITPDDANWLHLYAVISEFFTVTTMDL